MYLVNDIISFEEGALSDQETINLFSELIQTGIIHQLQGFYGRTTRGLIKAGWLTPSGAVAKGVKNEESK